MAIKKRQQVVESESSDEGGFDYESQEEPQSVCNNSQVESTFRSNEFLQDNDLESDQEEEDSEEEEEEEDQETKAAELARMKRGNFTTLTFDPPFHCC